MSGVSSGRKRQACVDQQGHTSFPGRSTVTEEQMKGCGEEAKWKVKEVVGNAIGDETITLKRQTGKALGKAQATHGQAKAPLKT
jgi:uncharacterized protein YjbJ (UPF0337 family)